MKDKVMESLKNFFRPEFLNRVDEIVLFDVLTPTQLESIVSIRIQSVAQRLKEKGIELEISPDALTYLAQTGYDPHFGARPLNRLIQTKILNPVANFILGRGVSKGDTVYVGMKGKELVVDMKRTSSQKKVKSGVPA
jgi:ATP-dependent Clp protease ATP-binding subunit ClpA